MAASMVDPVFGRLRAAEDDWVGKVEVGSLGVVRVAIASKHGWKQVRKPPTESQQRAFLSFVRRVPELMPRVHAELVEFYVEAWDGIEMDPFRPRNFHKLPRPAEREKILPLFKLVSIEVPIQEQPEGEGEGEFIDLSFDSPITAELRACITNCAEIELDAHWDG